MREGAGGCLSVGKRQSGHWLAVESIVTDEAPILPIQVGRTAAHDKAFSASLKSADPMVGKTSGVRDARLGQWRHLIFYQFRFSTSRWAAHACV